MAKTIKTKASFGTVGVDHFSPPLSSEVPKAININVSFEESLKLHLGLGQILGQLNSYNRNTKEGRKTCVNLCVFTDVHQITINEGLVGKRKETPSKLGIESKLKAYIEEVNATDLRETTKQTYITHATNFVRWINGDFEPGARI